MVLNPKDGRNRKVYLPKGEIWTEYATGKEYEGGQEIETDAPLDVLPVFVRKGAEIDFEIPGVLPEAANI